MRCEWSILAIIYWSANRVAPRFFFFPVIICDGTHYWTSSYTGKMFGFYAHDSFGTSILIAVAIIAEENIRHLAWTLECWIRHGMSVSLYPWFTDQGNFFIQPNPLFAERIPRHNHIGTKLIPIFTSAMYITLGPVTIPIGKSTRMQSTTLNKVSYRWADRSIPTTSSIGCSNI